MSEASHVMPLGVVPSQVADLWRENTELRMANLELRERVAKLEAENERLKEERA